VRDYLSSLPTGMDPYFTAPGPDEPGWTGITDIPPREFGPGIFGDPPGDLGPGITVDPPGLLGPLINYSEQPPQDDGGDGGQDEGGQDDDGGYTPTPGTPADDFTNEELAWLAYQHSGGGMNRAGQRSQKLSKRWRTATPNRFRASKRSRWITK